LLIRFAEAGDQQTCNAEPAAAAIWKPRDRASGFRPVFHGRLIFWIGNVIVAVLFVLAHLSSAKIVMPITPLLLAALFSINGLVSLVCAYLCWQRGLEAAILAHFSTDIVVHVIGPMFFRG
jgi:membrane protease YdiL (CAAX protease family)